MKAGVNSLNIKGSARGPKQEQLLVNKKTNLLLLFKKQAWVFILSI